MTHRKVAERCRVWYNKVVRIYLYAHNWTDKSADSEKAFLKLIRSAMGAFWNSLCGRMNIPFQSVYFGVAHVFGLSHKKATNHKGETGMAVIRWRIGCPIQGQTRSKGCFLSRWKGEIFGMIGANGAGKTTIIECIEGLRTKYKGSISVLGVDPKTQQNGAV